MKSFKFLVLILLIGAFSNTVSAQKIKLLEGDLKALKGEKKIQTELTFEGMSVGKYENEADYIKKKKDEYNKKEAGRGDAWEKSWIADREKLFHPKFDELFENSSDMQVSKSAKYKLIFKTTTTEPGWNIGISRRNAEIDAEVWIVESANPGNVIAKLTLQNALGRTFGGYDFDTGGRLAECYADSGKALGKFVAKQIK